MKYVSCIVLAMALSSCGGQANQVYDIEFGGADFTVDEDGTPRGRAVATHIISAFGLDVRIDHLLEQIGWEMTRTCLHISPMANWGCLVIRWPTSLSLELMPYQPPPPMENQQ